MIATKTKAKIITVCETKFDDSVTDNEGNIPNYSIIRKNRKIDGGGVCIYIHFDLAFNPRPDLDIPKMEAIWIEIVLRVPEKAGPGKWGALQNIIFKEDGYIHII